MISPFSSISLTNNKLGAFLPISPLYDLYLAVGMLAYKPYLTISLLTFLWLTIIPLFLNSNVILR